ncbi:MAG: M12 family metallopeptidase [Phycisphaerales bacterium]|nr:M12 family metallopeptidase [Phycisphaerales bacterium]
MFRSIEITALASLVMAMFGGMAVGQQAPVETSASKTSHVARSSGDLGVEREIRQCDLSRVPGNRGTMAGQKWPNGLVYYTFDEGISQTNQDRTRAAMNVLEAQIGVLFIPWTSESNYIFIFEGGGNFSAVGMQGGSQNLSMYNWGEQYIICHELIHALGRLHQQSRSDRDDYITVNYECIDPENSYNYDKCEQCPNHGGYDFESVMHYGQWGFSTGCPTMTCLPPYEEYQDVMGQRDGLSDGDIATLQYMYGSPGYGACCINSVCTDGVSEGSCEDSGGDYLGVDSSCDVLDCDGIIEVPKEFPTIQLAIDAARDGDEILVSPGLYRDTGDAVANMSGKSIWLHSSGGPAVTIIDGELARPCLELLNEEGEDSIVEGFTIIRGYGPAGGGIRVNGTPVILDCIVRENVGQSFAGGMMSTSPFGPTLTNVDFCHNILGPNVCANTFGTWNNQDNTCTLNAWCSCPGDANRDTYVTVDDLLAVIQKWGQSCLGCNEDLYLDGEINVEDLLEVLSWWNGDCPSFDCP